jgi:hypothetical protein
MRFEVDGSWNSRRTPWFINPAREKISARARSEFCQERISPGETEAPVCSQ